MTIRTTPGILCDTRSFSCICKAFEQPNIAQYRYDHSTLNLDLIEILVIKAINLKYMSLV